MFQLVLRPHQLHAAERCRAAGLRTCRNYSVVVLGHGEGRLATAICEQLLKNTSQDHVNIHLHMPPGAGGYEKARDIVQQLKTYGHTASALRLHPTRMGEAFRQCSADIVVEAGPSYPSVHKDDVWSVLEACIKTGSHYVDVSEEQEIPAVYDGVVAATQGCPSEDLPRIVTGASLQSAIAYSVSHALIGDTGVTLMGDEDGYGKVDVLSYWSVSRSGTGLYAADVRRIATAPVGAGNIERAFHGIPSRRVLRLQQQYSPLPTDPSAAMLKTITHFFGLHPSPVEWAARRALMAWAGRENRHVWARRAGEAMTRLLGGHESSCAYQVLLKTNQPGTVPVTWTLRYPSAQEHRVRAVVVAATVEALGASTVEGRGVKRCEGVLGLSELERALEDIDGVYCLTEGIGREKMDEGGDLLRAAVGERLHSRLPAFMRRFHGSHDAACSVRGVMSMRNGDSWMKHVLCIATGIPPCPPGDGARVPVYAESRKGTIRRFINGHEVLESAWLPHPSAGVVREKCGPFVFDMEATPRSRAGETGFVLESRAMRAFGIRIPDVFAFRMRIEVTARSEGVNGWDMGVRVDGAELLGGGMVLDMQGSVFEGSGGPGEAASHRPIDIVGNEHLVPGVMAASESPSVLRTSTKDLHDLSGDAPTISCGDRPP